MKKSLLTWGLMLAMTMTALAERKELHILSGNDMHAAIECFPRLGFIADSLRALYPDLLILSASCLPDGGADEPGGLRRHGTGQPRV